MNTSALDGRAGEGDPHSRRGGFSLIWLGLLALAFGVVEGAVAHYLRIILSSHSTVGAAAATTLRHTAAVESSRELATLILLAAAAALAARRGAPRALAFGYAFAIWDLSYYASLRLFAGWPLSISDWDLLFLLPAPWFGPVWAPISISALCVAASVHLQHLDRFRDLIVPASAIVLLAAALGCWEISFLGYTLPPADATTRDPISPSPTERVPQRYPWPWLAMGTAMAAAAWWRVGSASLARLASEPRPRSPATGDFAPGHLDWEPERGEVP